MGSCNRMVSHRVLGTGRYSEEGIPAIQNHILGHDFPERTFIYRTSSFPSSMLISFHLTTQGVYANLTIQLGETINSPILKVWGAMYAIFTFGLWIFAVTRTLPSVWDGTIFEAPCLGEADMLANRAQGVSCAMESATGTAVSAPEKCDGPVPCSATSSR